MSCMIYDIWPSFGQTKLSVPKNALPRDRDRKNVFFPPGAFVGCWAPTEVLLSPLSWWVMWLSLDWTHKSWEVRWVPQRVCWSVMEKSSLGSWLCRLWATSLRMGLFQRRMTGTQDPWTSPWARSWAPRAVIRFHSKLCSGQWQGKREIEASGGWRQGRGCSFSMSYPRQDKVTFPPYYQHLAEVSDSHWDSRKSKG